MIDQKPELSQEDIQIIVAENLAKLRQFHGMNQTQMAEKMRVHQVSYCMSEKGERELNLQNLYLLAIEFGINLNWLFGLSDERLNTISRKMHVENVKQSGKRRRQHSSRKNKPAKITPGGKNGGTK